MKARAIVMGACVALGVASMSTAADAKLAELLDKMHKVNSVEGQPILAEILQLGPGALKEVCGMVLPPGKGNDANAHYALHGLALYVVRPGAEAERKLYADAIIAALAAATDREVKAFFIRQLQLAGRDEAVPPLAKLLASPDLYEPATQALTRIATPAAVEAMAKALPDAKGGTRVTLIKALGQLRAKGIAPSILADAASNDPALRRAALYALANIADPGAAPLLAKAADVPSPYERSKATAFYLLFARRLAESGDKVNCARICRELIKTRTAPRERNVVTSALTELVAAVGQDALDDLMAATASPDLQLRAAALRLAETIPGEAMTARWVERLQAADPRAKADILGVLARRGDKAALPAVMAALKSGDKAVRLAAIPAAARLGGQEALSALLAALAGGDADEARAVKDALMRLGGADLMAAAAAALPNVPPASRVVLIETLAAGRAKAHVDAIFAAAKDADPAVRLAALKALGELADETALPRLVALLLAIEDGRERGAAQRAIVAAAQRIADPEARADALLAALGSAKGAQRATLLGVLARVGGKKALQAVVADTRSGEAEVQEAAIRALADWPDAAAAPELLAISQGSQKLVHQVLALRGFVRVVGDSDLPDAQKLALFKEALAAAKRPEEKKLILAGVAGVRTLDALKAVLPYLGEGELDEGPLQAEAAAAVVSIVCPPDDQATGLRGTEAVAALKRAIAAAKDPSVRKRAQAYLDSMPKPDELNIAQGKPVKASVPPQGNNTPDKAVDGNAADKNGSAWFGTRWPCSLEVDLQQPATIDSAHVFFYWDSRYFQYTLDTSLDGKTWKTVADQSKNTTPATAKGVMLHFAPVEARYVRLSILKNSANEAVHLVELKAYAAGKGPAKNP